MKNFATLFTFLFLFIGLTKAQQQFANSGFEQWDTIGDYTQPSSWYSLNPLTEFGLDASTTLTTNAHTGNYAVQLESISTSFSDLTGLICTGPILDANGNPTFDHMKIPFSGTPTQLEFYYISDVAAGDTSIVSVCLMRWNPTTMQSDTVASAAKLIYESKATYTLARVDFEYASPLPADSIFLIASSSWDGFNPTVGTKLILDDIQLVYGPTGIKKQQPLLAVSVYPNPASSMLEIESSGLNKGILTLTDYSGKTVLTQDVMKKQIDITGLANGIYFLNISSEEGVFNHKVIVQH